jgi:hypothetical protein
LAQDLTETETSKLKRMLISTTAADTASERLPWNPLPGAINTGHQALLAPASAEHGDMAEHQGVPVPNG